MDVKVKEDVLAIHQLPKLKLLLKKYRHVKTMQSGLLRLSELASTVTDMASFYPELESVISILMNTDSFHIALLDDSQELKLAYCHNPHEKRLFEHIQFNQWRQSLTGMVFEQKKPLHYTHDERIALAEKGIISFYGTAGLEWLGVPLERGSNTIGVLALHSYDEDLHFAKRDVQLLSFIADHIVTAIDRIRHRELLGQSIQQRTQKLIETNEKLEKEISDRKKAVKMHAALLSMSELTAESRDIESFYQALHEQVKTLLPAKNFYISLLSEDKQWLEFPYFNDEKSDFSPKRKLTNGLTEQAIKFGKPLLVTQTEIITLTESGDAAIEQADVKFLDDNIPHAWLGSPLISQGEIIGVLAVQHYQNENAYQYSDLDLIRFVSEHIATAIVRKRTQAQLAKNNAELEDLVNERTQELQATNLNLLMQIEERRKAETQLYHDAHHDALTKLPNRAMFSERLTYALRHIKRHPSNRFAVLFIDLDRFKMINDTLGHLAGDKFLIEISARLKYCVRDNDVLARLGGDEFVILLDSLQSQDDVEEIASRIITAISQPFELDGHSLYSNASIGIALCTNQYKDANEILRDADAAMYQAKSLGRGRYVFFDESMREKLIASMTLEQELRIAVQNKQFELHYQHISNLQLTNTIGFEALLRWNHPTKGILTPSEFLFMAEETGMILDIEIWVIEEVCQQLSAWKHSEEYNNAYIGVNLSGRHLTQSNELNKLISLIQKNTIEPERLILEFNENAFSQHTELALKGLRKLKEFGVKLALDDYGSGLSSFNFLHNYPFEFIKLDRSFIRTLNTNGKNLSLVKALNELGNQFGYRLVAEGIESAEMLDMLKGAGCEFGQGYHISRPAKLSPEEGNDNVVRLIQA